MYETRYYRPQSLTAAAQAFQESGDAAYLSGGHTLLPAMKSRLAAPANLIDLRSIPDLQGIDVSVDAVTIGAATVHSDVADSAAIQRAIPALSGLAGSIADIHVRHVGTIGGSVANNDPAADYPSAVLALKGVVETDRRTVPANEFFTGLYSTALDEGEIVTRIAFRIPQSSAYAKFRNPASRYAMAAAFVARYPDGEVHVAITGAGNEGVFRWREAENALRSDFSARALDGLAVDPSGMMSDMHGAPDYRAHLVAVMTRRAVDNPGGVLVWP